MGVYQIQTGSISSFQYKQSALTKFVGVGREIFSANEGKFMNSFTAKTITSSFFIIPPMYLK